MKYINFNSIQFFLAVMLVTMIMISCGEKEKDPQPTNEEEVITTIQLTFTDSADANNKITATFKDADGEGGNPPTRHDTIRLAANKTYFASIKLLDESKNPAEDISEEVEEEKDEHMFFFHKENVEIDVLYNDKDSKNLPVGLSSIWRTKAAGNGKMKIILKHQQNVKDGTETPGETDVDISFETEVK